MEVDTFRRRAIEDTQQNVTAMEKSRTEYRASLSWMKEVSQQLDPDTNKQMERFRKSPDRPFFIPLHLPLGVDLVQTQVRRSKARFDQQKLDCLQKVDLLAAARCNMFSHALILYQNQLLAFAQNASKTFSSIASSFTGYQHYEFSVVKELAETSLKLAEETGVPAEDQQQADKDHLIYNLKEYEAHTIINSKIEDQCNRNDVPDFRQIRHWAIIRRKLRENFNLLLA
ncbi:hypothetical protein B566_EDAN017622 [Ephemera danica]|nr:hypothetical protein B566_EDAN017622 [Ephemera danica]